MSISGSKKIDWDVGLWSPCAVKPGSSKGIRHRETKCVTVLRNKESSTVVTIPCAVKPGSSKGIRHRETKCVTVLRNKESSTVQYRNMRREVCDGIPEPPTTEKCEVTDKQDCVVTEFSDWSECCDNAQHRVRSVLVAPSIYGKPCPQLSEWRNCDDKGVSCKRQKSQNNILSVGPWSKCERFEPEGAHSLMWQNSDLSDNYYKHWPQVGYQKRTLSCYNSSGFDLDLSECMDSKKGPLASRSCIMSQDCVVTPWTDWKEVKRGCIDENGKWTLKALHISHIALFFSECMDSKKGPLASRSCIMSQDCVVTPWTDWKEVKRGCIDENGKNWPTVSERTRDVSKLHEGSGKQCPHLKETNEERSGTKCTDLYKWLTSSWSRCKLPKGLSQELCGGGLQFRNVTCVSKETGWAVSEDECHLNPLPTVQRCEVPCERDCSVSLWSPWGPCLPAKACPVSDSEPMPLKGFRRRSRQVIEAPSENGLECPATDACFRRRSRQVIEAPSENGLECPATDEIQTCSNPQCYHWYADVWSSCILDPGVGKCGNGVRMRKIMCKDHGGETVADYHCTKLKPVAQESCLIPCPNDCVVSGWSDWTACSSQCFDGKLTPYKTRNRTVIAPPGPGGHQCPPASEMTQIESCNTHDCHKFSWLTLPWQPCNATCGQGVQVREVWCMEDNEMKLPDARCQLLPKPPEWRPCTKRCPEPCVYSDWTEWSSCQNLPTCTKTDKDELIYTQRTREILSGENCNERLIERIPCKKISGKCPEYNWALGSWSQCQMGPDRTCGSGLRARDIWCSADGSSTHVEIKYCIKTQAKVPPSIERCHVDCSKPCTVTDWSHWSPCDQPCTGVRSRTRQLIGELGVRFSPFGLYYNTYFTTIEFHSRCIDKRTEQAVDNKYCDWATQPSDINNCHVACPGDCVLSSWSEWSSCLGDCSNTQQRTRSMLRAPSIHGAPCPHSIQTQACHVNLTCFTYKWAVTKYSSCLPLGGSPCGEGKSYGLIFCERSDGRLVDFKFCKDQPVPYAASKWCYIDCPVDCELSKWDDWNESKCTCNQTGKHQHFKPLRRRGITQPGLTYRNVTCVRGDNKKPVEHWLCPTVSKPTTSDICNVPCETDCQLSEWSHWSHCHGDCKKDKAGYQTRSRAVIRQPKLGTAKTCPEPLWETKDCDLGPCLTFDWVVTGEGSIVCKRSDGLTVVGGCDSIKRPTKSGCQVIDGRCVCTAEPGVIVEDISCQYPDVTYKYDPNDDLNVWFWAMVGTGIVFIIFVITSVYLVCSDRHDPNEVYCKTLK
ncbi:thrombospondin type-1 domain-containing protein 7B [Diaphorina citri]|uniref:Thrombospondin type-1 domain-containing protein 7B n=1 Tax=Diaphorina citri TaxID=121845 RepID=A0A3Q0JCS4_DIACI|nr:thrombospondin type-1 domain-containing protein 7B [Diaphorina citri]